MQCFSAEPTVNCEEIGWKAWISLTILVTWSLVKKKLNLNESSNVKGTAQFILDFYNKRSKIVNQNVLPNL